MRTVFAIIVAAGQGRRFGLAKQFAALKGRPILDWTLDAFENHPQVAEIVLVLPDEKDGARFIGRYPKISAVVRGGRRRQDSVRRGFARVRAGAGDVVLVHDGVRPLVSAAVISRVIREAARRGAAVPVVPVEDTIKEVFPGKGRPDGRPGASLPCSDAAGVFLRRAGSGRCAGPAGSGWR